MFLNDWGCAAITTQPTTFRGALRHAPARILEVLKLRTDATYMPKPEDDLEMVVKVVFELMNLGLYSQIAQVNDPADILLFWQEHLVGGSKTTWQKMLGAAQACDYALLKTLICELL